LGIIFPLLGENARLLHLSKIKDLLVIFRTTVEQYRKSE